MKTTSANVQIMLAVTGFGLAISARAVQHTNTVTATVDTRDYVLVVDSAYGDPIPAVGTNIYSWHSSVSFGSINYALESPRTNHNNLGWHGTGSVGDGPDWRGDTVVLTSLLSTVEWQWDNEYYIQSATIGTGTVVPEGLWVTEGNQGQLSAVAGAGWLLTGWSGDATAGPETTNLTVTADRALDVTAAFSDDPDGDGLKNVDEWAHGANPWLTDTDGDRFDDKTEVDHGGDPAHNDDWRADYIRANSDRFDLYPSNVVMDVGVGQMGLQIENSRARIALQLQSSSDLQAWTNVGEVVSWELPVDGDKRFMRVRTTPQP